LSKRGIRFDEILGQQATLIGRNLARGDSMVQLLDLTAAESTAFKPMLETWLQTVGAESVLVRPDRHIFGIGSPDDLLRKWNLALGGRSGPPNPITSVEQC
jgi:3-(3-hydroxy-phenyl)propionate hydroxylase